MSYNGYLIKLKARGNHEAVNLPLKYMGIGSYNCTPNQRMESKASRSLTGVLHRTTVEHTPTKIEFDTPVISNTDVADLNDMIQDRWTNSLERKLEIQYYDMETDTYKDATVYMPDVTYKINHITQDNKVYYKPIRYAFIEY